MKETSVVVLAVSMGLETPDPVSDGKSFSLEGRVVFVWMWSTQAMEKGCDSQAFKVAKRR